MTDKEPTVSKNGMKLEFTGRGTVLLETVGFGPITFDFDEVEIAQMLMKIFIENCEDGIPTRSFDEKEQEVVHTLLKRIPHSE